MLQKFIKYQSLGNHFIIFDWRAYANAAITKTLQATQWPLLVQSLCKQAFGVGADGVLVITPHSDNATITMHIFNADGSAAENCLNGLRCVAHYLLSDTKLPDITIAIGPRINHCSQDQHTQEIITSVGSATLGQATTIECANKIFTGQISHIGNPHFLIEQEISYYDFTTYAPLIESHPQFPHKTNVEFFWIDPTPQANNHKLSIIMKPFERGAGPTLACSSGVAVLLDFLLRTNRIQSNDIVACTMPGGSVTGWVNEQNIIYLQAAAHHIFDGALP